MTDFSKCPSCSEVLVHDEECWNCKDKSNPSALRIQVGGLHYKDYPIQPAEFCQKNKIPYCEANAIKYLCRWRSKGGIEDLRKVKHYVDLLIEIEGLE